MDKAQGRWRIPQNVRVTSDGDSLLLLSPKGEYFGLDDVGARVWRGLEQGDLTETARKLRDEYGVPAEVIDRDIDALLSELQRAGLVLPDAK